LFKGHPKCTQNTRLEKLEKIALALKSKKDLEVVAMDK
tara:strand:+ start:707 stop:820 length:114 start_codon:yes stop_codon:yes gene_type:complete